MAKTLDLTDENIKRIANAATARYVNGGINQSFEASIRETLEEERQPKTKLWTLTVTCRTPSAGQVVNPYFMQNILSQHWDDVTVTVKEKQ